MVIFNATVGQLLMMLVLILAGFFIRRKKLISRDAHTTLSKLETLVFLPALNLSTQLTQCTSETFRENAPLILYGLPLIFIPIAISFPISQLLASKNKDKSPVEYERNIYKYALSFANYGFVGNFIILGIWGSEIFYKYSLFTFSFGPISLAWGLYLLIPREENQSTLKSVKKAFLSPPLLAMIFGMVGGLLGLGRFVPSFIETALENASACMGPIAMLITGFVIGGYEIKPLFFSKKGYFVAFLRLIAVPSIVLLILKLFGAPEEMLILALVSFGTPVGLNSIIFPAAYGGDTRPGASMLMITQLFCVITLPLLYLLFVAVI